MDVLKQMKSNKDSFCGKATGKLLSLGTRTNRATAGHGDGNMSGKNADKRASEFEQNSR